MGYFQIISHSLELPGAYAGILRRGFHYSYVTVILEWFILFDCSIRVSQSFHQNHNSEKYYKVAIMLETII